MMNLILWILRIGVFLALAVFASKNAQSVVLHYYLDKSIELPLSVVVLSSFALGVVMTLLLAWRPRSKK